MMIDIDDYNKELFQRQIKEEGYCVVKNVISKDELEQLKKETLIAIYKEAEFHGGTEYRDFGIVQACPMYGGSFLTLLENKKLMEPFNDVMGEGSILYVYISSCMPPYGKNFSSRIHVDRPRLFQNYCECLAGLVMLTDFTKENGSTYILPSSHNDSDQPSEQYFYENAIQIEAPAGSVLYFNLRLWHAGGFNNTDEWRQALALGVVRPNMKQKFDYPAMIQHYDVNTDHITDYAKQKLGYFSIPPKSLEEFYGPDEIRTYKEVSEWKVKFQS